MSDNSCLITLVHIFHKILVYFMVFGCLLPQKYLLPHLLLWPIVYIHWQFNDQRCCLTQLELYLKDKTKTAPTIQEDHGDDYYFLKSLLKDYDIELSKDHMQLGIYTLFTASWLISLVRYLKYKQKQE